ncbi:MAG: ribonuclease III [Kiritimatiellae bacterium]|nr:ribonuclease III [Kiritimatiellia bacterium]
MRKNVDALRALEKLINYRFKNRQLLEMALTHRSYRFENAGISHDNQRLEFLGDAVLDLVLAEFLYEKYPDKGEGFLTSTRSRLVSGRGLAVCARGLELGEFLRIGKGEEASGGRERESNLADCLEAIVGAAYLDRGHKAARRVIIAVILPQLGEAEGCEWRDNPKGKLQEYSQRRWKEGPEYEVVKATGPAHERVFTVAVRLPDGREVTAQAPSKQAAEAAAATCLITDMQKEDVNDG